MKRQTDRLTKSAKMSSPQFGTHNTYFFQEIYNIENTYFQLYYIDISYFEYIILIVRTFIYIIFIIRTFSLKYIQNLKNTYNKNNIYSKMGPSKIRNLNNGIII